MAHLNVSNVEANLRVSFNICVAINVWINEIKEFI